jgi:hypothetical protein
MELFVLQKLLKLSKPTADWGNQNDGVYGQPTNTIDSEKTPQQDQEVKHITTQL